jgi:hypothetical protein
VRNNEEQKPNWEREFVGNIEQLIKNGKTLSQKQFNTLKEIADK